MVEETIKTIKETENEAEAIINKAADTCADILAKAAEDAKSWKQQEEAAAKAAADTAMAEAVSKGEQDTAEAMKSVEAEIDALKAEVKEKEEEAMASVIAELI